LKIARDDAIVAEMEKVPTVQSAINPAFGAESLHLIKLAQ
jgi:hypothetical protein